MSDSPISRRNFLYGMVGAGRRSNNLLEESSGQADLKREPRTAASCLHLGTLTFYELGLGGSYNVPPLRLSKPATRKSRYRPAMYRP